MNDDDDDDEWRAVVGVVESFSLVDTKIEERFYSMQDL
jgi:hypothetical protein